MKMKNILVKYSSAGVIIFALSLLLPKYSLASPYAEKSAFGKINIGRKSLSSRDNWNVKLDQTILKEIENDYVDFMRFPETDNNLIITNSPEEFSAVIESTCGGNGCPVDYYLIYIKKNETPKIIEMPNDGDGIKSVTIESNRTNFVTFSGKEFYFENGSFISKIPLLVDSNSSNEHEIQASNNSNHEIDKEDSIDSKFNIKGISISSKLVDILNIGASQKINWQRTIDGNTEVDTLMISTPECMYTIHATNDIRCSPFDDFGISHEKLPPDVQHISTIGSLPVSRLRVWSVNKKIYEIEFYLRVAKKNNNVEAKIILEGLEKKYGSPAVLPKGVLTWSHNYEELSVLQFIEDGIVPRPYSEGGLSVTLINLSVREEYYNAKHDNEDKKKLPENDKSEKNKNDI